MEVEEYGLGSKVIAGPSFWVDNFLINYKLLDLLQIHLLFSLTCGSIYVQTSNNFFFIELQHKDHIDLRHLF